MKKILTVLLIATVMAMAAPAMANPENQPIAVASNQKSIFVEVEGAIATNSNIAQTLTNYGDLDNWAMGVAVGGNAIAESANVGTANSGASSGVAASYDSMGESEATAYNNTATVDQYSTASAWAGSPEGIGGPVTQTNTVSQWAYAYIDNNQALIQPVVIDEYQSSYAYAPGTQNITDSMFNEDDWTKYIYKYIN